MPPRITLSTGSLFGYNLEHLFAMAQAMGFDGLEVLLTETILAEGPASLAELSDRIGLPVLSVHFPILGRNSDVDLHHAYERSAAFAADLPVCEAVVVHTPLAPTLHTPVGQAYVQSLRRAQALLDRARTVVAIENRGIGMLPAQRAHLDELGNLRLLAEEWELGLTYDIGHAVSWGFEPLHALATMGSRVCNVHLYDSRPSNPFLRLPFCHSHLRDHQPLGVGHLPIERFLHRLVATGYGGLITLEFSPIALHLPTPWGAAARIAESLAISRAALNPDTAPAAEGAHRRDHVDSSQ